MKVRFICAVLIGLMQCLFSTHVFAACVTQEMEACEAQKRYMIDLGFSGQLDCNNYALGAYDKRKSGHIDLSFVQSENKKFKSLLKDDPTDATAKKEIALQECLLKSGKQGLDATTSQNSPSYTSTAPNNQQSEADLPEWMNKMSDEERAAFQKDRENSKKKTYRVMSKCLSLANKNNNYFTHNSCNIKVGYSFCWTNINNPNNLECEKQQFGSWMVGPQKNETENGPGDREAHSIYYVGCEYPGFPQNERYENGHVKFDCK